MPTDTDTDTDVGPLMQLVREVAGVRAENADVRELVRRVDRLVSHIEEERAAAQPLARIATVMEKTFDWLTATPDPSNPGRSRFQELVRNAGWFVLATGSGGTVVEIAHRMGWP